MTMQTPPFQNVSPIENGDHILYTIGIQHLPRCMLM